MSVISMGGNTKLAPLNFNILTHHRYNSHLLWIIDHEWSFLPRPTSTVYLTNPIFKSYSGY